MTALVRKLSSARPSVRRKAAAAVAELARKAREADALRETLDLTAQRAAASVNALREVRAVTSGVKVPNGTTKRIARIVESALA